MMKWFLSLSPDLLTGNGTYIAWSAMQNVANVIMVIILLIVIFSQLTGWGIDNYGVKKMLPKLVVMAIVVNLSFVFCELAIDLSNIMGKGLADLGKEAASAVNSSVLDAAASGAVGIMTGIFGAAGAIAGAGAAAVATGVLVTTWPFWLIVLIVVLVVVLVAVLVFFIMMALRNVLAIACVVLAPVAFVCYILPNTQNLYKRWWKLFCAALVIYPICGGLYGISKVVRAITMGASGVHIFMVIITWVFTFTPFMLAPTLVRKMLNSLNDIGATFNGLVQRARQGYGRAVSTAMRSEPMKERQKQIMAQRAANSNEKFQQVRDKAKAIREKQARGETLTRRERSMLNRADRQANSRAARYQFAMNEQRVKQQRDSDRAAMQIAMRAETGNYDNDIMASQLNGILDRMESDPSSVSDTDRLKAEALASQLSQQAGGSSKLADAIVKMNKNTGEIMTDANGRKLERTGEAARFIGKYMGQDAKVRQALENKQRPGAMRVSDISSGAIDARMGQDIYDKLDVGFLANARRTGQTIQLNAAGTGVEGQEAWLQAEHQRALNSGETTEQNYATWRNNRTTVEQDLVRNVLDKDKDFVSQKGAVVTRYARPELMGQDRINRMANRQGLFDYGDVAEGTEQTIKSRAVYSEGAHYVQSEGGVGPARRVEVARRGNQRYEMNADGSLGQRITEQDFGRYQPETQYNQAQERAIIEGQQEMRVREEEARQAAQQAAAQQAAAQQAAAQAAAEAQRAAQQLQQEQFRLDADDLMSRRQQQAQAQPVNSGSIILSDNVRASVAADRRRVRDNFETTHLASARQNPQNQNMWNAPAGWQKVQGYDVFYNPADPESRYYDARLNRFKDKIY